jgi:hypothetical protein
MFMSVPPPEGYECDARGATTVCVDCDSATGAAPSRGAKLATARVRRSTSYIELRVDWWLVARRHFAVNSHDEGTDMNTNLFKLMGCIAWAAVAVSSATPASAKARTPQLGGWASCSANYNATYDNSCGLIFNYAQIIKFVNQGCSSGGCSPVSDVTLVENVYPLGRKVSFSGGGCSTSNNYYLFDLYTCAC